MDKPVCLSIHLLIGIWLVPGFGYTNKASENIHVQGFAWTQAFISFR